MDNIAIELNDISFKLKSIGLLMSTLPTDLYKRDDLINFYRYFNQELKDKAKKLDKLLELLYKSSFPVSVIDVLENIALDLSNISILANNLSLDTCNTDDLSAGYCYIGQEVEKKADIIKRGVLKYGNYKKSIYNRQRDCRRLQYIYIQSL